MADRVEVAIAAVRIAQMLGDPAMAGAIVGAGATVGASMVSVKWAAILADEVETLRNRVAWLERGTTVNQ